MHAPDILDKEFWGRSNVELFDARLVDYVERFEAQGVKIKGIVAIGGITRKSKLVMQVLADVLNRPIRVGASDQACALGAGMFAATVAKLYPSVEDAQKKMFPGFDLEFKPNAKSAKVYDGL